MTWKEFKKAVEGEGVKDDDELSYIDWDGWAEILIRREGSEVAIF